MERGVPIRSISRCIAVLQAVNRKGSLSLMGIARAADLPYPTTCRMVQTLIHEGLIECEPTRKYYRATALVQSLSQGFSNHDDLVHASRPHIEALTLRAGWPVSVITRAGQSMMVRDSTQNLTSLTFNLYSPGYVMPLLECASGYVHLAFAVGEERRSLFDGLTPADDVCPLVAGFDDEVTGRKIREAGYATFEREAQARTPGTTSSISVPILDGQVLVGALTMSFFASAMQMSDALERHLGDLKGAAFDIGAALSILPPPVATLPRRRKTPQSSAVHPNALQCATSLEPVA